MTNPSPLARRRFLMLALTAATAAGAVVSAPRLFAAAEDKKADSSEGKSVEALAKEGYWGEPDNWKEHEKLLGKPMPKLDLSNWVDEKKKLDGDAMKDKIVVVDFWATWCGPCIASIPHNNEVAKKYADKGVVLLGACGGGGEEKMPKVAEDKKIEYPTAKVSEDSTKAWAVQWWPTYAVVDRKGNVRALGIKPDYVDKVVDALLKEQPAEKKTASAAE